MALSFCWGLSWTAMRIALDEVSPWSMRLIGYSIGAATLLCCSRRRAAASPSRAAATGCTSSSPRMFLVVAFGVAGTFAQLMANTSRVIIVNYSMPVWGSLMAYFVLRERINARAALGLALCVAGLGVLVYPVAEQSLREPIGLLLALVLRAVLGRRHGLHEMGAHQGRPAGDHVLAGHGRRRRCSPSAI